MTQRNRQLAAIVFTDIVGYATLMNSDEGRASQIRRRHRAVFEELNREYGGRILQYYGDGTLSIFNSSVAAVECAVHMQRAFREEPAVPLRIGIHVGDIAYDEIEVYGDGLNVAARIEPCCVTGGVFITGKVYDDIRNHEWLSARQIGVFTFKGIEEAVMLYAVDNEGVAVPGADDILKLSDSSAKLVAITTAPAPGLVPEKVRQAALISIPILLLVLIVLNVFYKKPPQVLTLALPAPAESSIAVLPFENVDALPENNYFSDGVTEDIQSLLSHVDGLKVVSRSSAMQYKGTDKNIPQIGRELGADHILKGSVRRDGDKVHVTAQLIDARKNDPVWTKIYDREAKEIFGVQSQVAKDIAATLSKKLSKFQADEIYKKPTQNLEAYENYLKGREHYFQYSPQGNDQAIGLFREALRADPSFAQAYAGLGDALAQKALSRGLDQMLLDSAADMSKKAIALDRNLSEGHKALGLVYHYEGRYDNALVQYYEAIKRNPNNAMAAFNISSIYESRGAMAEAILWAQYTLGIDPRQSKSMLLLASLYLNIGDDNRCEELLRRGLRDHPDFAEFKGLLAHMYLLQQNIPAARELGLQLLAESGEDAAGYDIMGEIALWEGKPADARAYWTQAARLAEKTMLGYEPLWQKVRIAYLDQLQGGGKAQAGLSRLRDEVRQLEEKTKSTKEEHSRKGKFVLLGTAYAVFDERDRALQWLQRAADENWLDYRSLSTHPFYENLRADRRFQDLLRDMESRLQAIRNNLAARGGDPRMS